MMDDIAKLTFDQIVDKCLKMDLEAYEKGTNPREKVYRICDFVAHWRYEKTKLEQNSHD